MGTRDLGAIDREAGKSGPPVGRVLLACLAGWVLPGGGHWLLGRRRRGAAFFGLVVAAFVMGAFLHGRFSVLDRRQPFLSAMQVLACVGAGPMEIAARSAVYGSPVYRMPELDNGDPGDMRSPQTPVGRTLRERNEAPDSSYGTAYLWTAGLMNLLLILDVFDIGVGRKQ